MNSQFFTYPFICLIIKYHIISLHAVIGGMLIDMLDEMVKAAKGKPVIIINPSLGKAFPCLKSVKIEKQNLFILEGCIICGCAFAHD